MTTKTLELALRLNEQQQATCTTKMFLSSSNTDRPAASNSLVRPHHRRRKMPSPSPSIGEHLLLGLLGCLSLAATLALCQYAGELSAGDPQLVVVADQQQQLAAAAASNQVREILVQPNSARRIECRLPSLETSKKRYFYWNFVKSPSNEVTLLCIEDRCPDDSALGIQLMNDSISGAYDLFIPRVSYDLHNGLYSCQYKDSEANQTIKKDFRLTVLIPPQAPTISAALGSAQSAREGQEYQLNCTTLGANPEPTIGWFKNGEQLGQPAPGFIRIEQRSTGMASTSILSFVPTAEDHLANYKCRVWNRAMGESAPFERDFALQVEYSPRISLGLFNPLRVLQSSPVTLSCHVDANPPVKGIKWFKDQSSQPISNQFNHTIVEARVQDAGEYTCQADNGIAPPGSYVAGAGHHAPASQSASSSSSSSSGFLSILNLGGSSQSDSGRHSTAAEAQLQLQVLYGPRVSVRPYQQLVGSSSSSPPPPQQPLPILNEGESFGLRCAVDASPPAFEYIWTKADDPNFKRISAADNTLLEFSSLSAQDGGNYTCTAFNRLNPSSGGPQAMQLERQGSGSAMLLVRHKPGVASLELGSGGETELGSKTQLVCRTKPPGYPEPAYKFYKHFGGNKMLLSKQANHPPVHTIHSAKADDEARYSCEASNELGRSSEADGELVVNEPPQVIPDNALRSMDTRAQGERPYSITVRASGKPVPKVSWFHRSPQDGRQVELAALEVSSRYEITTNAQPDHRGQDRSRWTVTSTLTFKQPLEVNDRGLYTVQFDNGLSRSALHKFQLHIYHAPIPAPKNQPILVAGGAGGATFGRQQGAAAAAAADTQIKAGFDLGEPVNLTCRVSAWPQPEFEWRDKSSSGDSSAPLDTNNRYKTSVANVLDDVWEGSLSFDVLQESDYGNYLCEVANFDQKHNQISASVRMVVSLVRKTIPDVPSQLEAVEASQESITLQWLPGFDGGGTNLQYQVQYAPDDGPTGQSLAKRYPNLIDTPPIAPALAGLEAGTNSLEVYDQQQQEFPKLQICQAPNSCTIDHLSPRQAYLFRVRARSSLGASEFSDQLRASTRANLSQIPRILEASYDTSQNILYFRVEPGSDYLLNNLNARIEARSHEPPSAVGGQLDEQLLTAATAGEWRLHSLVPLRHERAQAHLNMQPEAEQLRITLCSKSNESLCGAEFVVSLRSAASSFLQDQRGLSVTMLAFTLLMIAFLGLIATSVHSCCVSRRKNKKADAIERSSGAGGAIDNKPTSGTGQSHAQSQTSNGGAGIIKGSHGSTTSTNSTSATNGAGPMNGLQSMDSIVNGVGGSSDRSSDHSRQAKLDSMLPPNYNHYADRASILMEQQQQMQLQQQGLMSAHDKLSSPFGLANSALLGITNQHHQLPSPMMNGGGQSNYFTYGQTPLDFQQQQHQPDGSDQMLGLETTDGKQPQMWPTGGGGGSQMDDYSNYNPLAYSAMQNQQAQDQQQQLDPTYGTTASLMMSQQSAAYDNSSNQFQSAYMSSAAGYQQQQHHHQQQQYQQELANAQQQMYGTLTRNGYSANATNNPQAGAGGDTSSLAHDQTALGSSSQQQLYEQQYGTTNGLMQAPQLPPPPTSQAQESDYGTAGARRPIREIIV